MNKRFKRISANYLTFRGLRHLAIFFIAIFTALTEISKAPLFLFLFYMAIRVTKDTYFLEELVLEYKLFQWLKIGKHHDENTDYSVVLEYKITDEKIFIRGLLDGLSEKETNNMLDDTNKRLFQTLIHRRLEGFEVADDYSYVEFEFFKDEDKHLNVSDYLKEHNTNEIQITERRSWNLDDSPHALISGGTGSGKSYFIMYLLLQFELMNAETYVIDPKMSDLMRFNQFYEERVFGADKNEIIAVLKRLNDKLTERQLQKLNINKEQRPLFIVFDEFPAFYASIERKEQKEVDSILSQIVLKGRSLRVFLVLAMQRADASTLPAQIRDQFGLRIALSRTSKAGLTMIFADDAKELTEMTKSQHGYLKSNDMTIPVRFKTPYFDINIHEAFNYVFKK
jgi:hypothetical protein